MLERDDFQHWRLPKCFSHGLSCCWDGVLRCRSDLHSATVFKGNPCLQGYFWSNTSPEICKNHDYCLFGIFTSKKWGGKEAQPQSYWTKCILLQHNSIRGGTGTGLQITKLPEEINHKKYTQSKTDTSHYPAPQQKTRRCKSTSELLP